MSAVNCVLVMLPCASVGDRCDCVLRSGVGVHRVMSVIAVFVTALLTWVAAMSLSSADR